MKVLTKIVCAGMLVALVAGCASDGPYVPKLPPHAQAMYLDFQKQPNNKVFVVAIDPSGDFAVGSDSGKATKKEAYQVALAQCNESREAYGVLSEAHIYAVNDKVVYEDVITKAEAE